MPAPLLVQSATVTGDSNPATLTATFGSNTGTGNCVAVYATSAFPSAAGQTVSGVTLGGSAGNMARAKASGASGDGNAEIWTDQNAASGQTSVVVSFTGGSSNGATAAIEEWANVVLVSAVDKTNGQSQGSTANWSSLSSGVLSQTVEVGLGLVVGSGVGSNVAITGPASPWVNAAQLNDTNLFALSLRGHNVVSATTTLTYNGTFASGLPYSAVIVTLKGILPAIFQPTPGRGKPGVTGRSAIVRTNKIMPPPPAPSPFRQPVPGKGKAGITARHAVVSQGSPVTPVIHLSPFPQPIPRHGATAAVRGRLFVSEANIVTPPISPFRQPVPSKGRTAATRGIAAFLSFPRGGPVITIPSLFRQPSPSHGRTAAKKGIAGNLSFGSPVILPVHRQLLVSLASQAGTDDYGFNFPQGIFASTGVIEGPVFQGPDFIINSNGYFFYSGTPAFGNLILSVTNAAGSDNFGNPTQSGFTAYNNSNNTWAQLNSGAVAFSNGSVISNALTGTLDINNNNITAIILNNNTNEIDIDANTVNANGNNLIKLFGNLDPSGMPLSGSANLTAVINAVNSMFSRFQAMGVFL